MKINETDMLVKVDTVILEYCEKGDHLPIDSLLKIQDKLAGYLYFLGTSYSDAYALTLTAYTSKKMKTTKQFLIKKAEKIDGEKGMSDKMAEQFAIDQTTIELSQEVENDIRAQRLKITIDRADKVLGSISQRVSHLKMELRESKQAK